MAELSRQHNHANVLCLGARITEPDVAMACLEAFLSASPDLGERHVRRIVKLDS
jgi:ribose 5-phosphate isomerase B